MPTFFNQTWLSNAQRINRKGFRSLLVSSLFLATVPAAAQTTGMLSAEEKARDLCTRITGVPPSAAMLAQVVTSINAGDLKAAAATCAESPDFINVKVRNFAAKWATIDGAIDIALNDLIATVAGFVRDGKSFQGILSEDSLYILNSNGLPTYSLGNNDHYETAEQNGVDLNADLMEVQGSTVQGGFGDAAAIAGLISTRTFGKHHFTAGTNRLGVMEVMKNYLCIEKEELLDTTRDKKYIGPDIPRNPAGDTKRFENYCSGCHSGMDGLRKYSCAYDVDQDNEDFPDGLYTYRKDLLDEGKCVPKFYVNGDTYPDGYFTNDDNWELLWHEGKNKVLGWKAPFTGKGAKSFGELITRSPSFPLCMSKQVFESINGRKATTDADKAIVRLAAEDFRAGGYLMKSLFVDIAAKSAVDPVLTQEQPAPADPAAQP